MFVSLEAMGRIFENCPADRLKDYHMALTVEMGRAEVNTIDRAAALFSQLKIESGDLKFWTEWDNGTGFARYDYRVDLGNNRAGDGKRYCGRGPIQTTGKKNYKRASQKAFEVGKVPDPEYYLNYPDLLAEPEHGFFCSLLYWTDHKLNLYADALEIGKISHIVNAGPWKSSFDQSNRTYRFRMGKVRHLVERFEAWEWARYVLRVSVR